MAKAVLLVLILDLFAVEQGEGRNGMSKSRSALLSTLYLLEW